MISIISNHVFSIFPCPGACKLVKVLYHLFPSHSFPGACKLVREGAAAIFGPQSRDSALHVRSVCEAKSIPHLEARWVHQHHQLRHRRRRPQPQHTNNTSNNYGDDDDKDDGDSDDDEGVIAGMMNAGQAAAEKGGKPQEKQKQKADKGLTTPPVYSVNMFPHYSSLTKAFNDVVK